MKRRRKKKNDLFIVENKKRRDKERAMANQKRKGRITEYYAMATRDL